MSLMRAHYLAVALFCFTALLLTPLWADEPFETRSEVYARYVAPGELASGDIYPQWMDDGNRFWWSEGFPGNFVIRMVDPGANRVEPLFDVPRLREAIEKATGKELNGKGLPFSFFEFEDGESAAVFYLGTTRYRMQFDSYTVTPLPAEARPRTRPAISPRVLGLDPWKRRMMREVPSPDGNWLATLKDHNVWIRSSTDSENIQLTTDGSAENEYTHWWATEFAAWSCDSNTLIVNKVDYRNVPELLLLPLLKPTAAVERVKSPRADSEQAHSQLFLIDVATKRQTPVGIAPEPNQWIRILQGDCITDGSEFLVIRLNGSGDQGDLMAVNKTSGAARVIITETGKRIPDRRSRKFLVQQILSDGKRFIAKSFRDGWPHFYLHDMNGELICQLTQGDFAVVEVTRVDEESGWVYYTAHGDPERPYDTHLYRVPLQGGDSAQLTEGHGQHDVLFSPACKFFLDTYSTVADPPVVELRKADGTLLRVLRNGQWKRDKLSEFPWTRPKEFVVKAADGKTDLHGVLFKPFDLDPNKKYPVIENIYGTGSPLAPHSFYPNDSRGDPAESHALAQLGFVVIVLDARGTKERSREFYEAGIDGRQLIPDHVAALKQLAHARPYIDLTRVGVYGHSGGGKSTIRALLEAPDDYHVGVAFAPAVDAESSNLSIPSLGVFEENKSAYEVASLSRRAANLKGKLLIVQGTADTTTPFGETMKLVDAFLRAGKPHHLLIVPDDGHGLRKYGDFVRNARARYFQEHLQPVPDCRITPPEDAVFDVSKAIVFHAAASASADSRVISVAFFVDGKSAGIDAEPPYTLSWNSPTTGSHTLWAVVSDSSGRSERSNRIEFVVGKQ